MSTIARAGQGPNHWSHHLLTRVPISKKQELEVDLEFKSRHYDMACRQHNRCLHLNTKCALLLYFLCEEQLATLIFWLLTSTSK